MLLNVHMSETGVGLNSGRNGSSSVIYQKRQTHKAGEGQSQVISPNQNRATQAKSHEEPMEKGRSEGSTQGNETQVKPIREGRTVKNGGGKEGGEEV